VAILECCLPPFCWKCHIQFCLLPPSCWKYHT
jgi:hypothetical protein